MSENSKSGDCSSSFRSLPASADRMINQLRLELPDRCRFYHTAVLLSAQFHQSFLVANTFKDILAEVPLDASRATYADALGDALRQTLPAIDPELSAHMRSHAHALIRGVVVGDRRALEQSSLPWGDVVSHEWTNCPDTHALRFEERWDKAIEYPLSQIRGKFQQLVDFYPRFRDLMTRGGLLDSFIAIGARLVFGDIGGAVTEPLESWAKWQEKSDAHFTQAYVRAIEDFKHTTPRFFDQAKQSVRSIADQLSAGWAAQRTVVITGLEDIARSGHSLSEAYESLHFDAAITQATTELFREFVIHLLKDEEGLPSVAVNNLREIYGLDLEDA